MARSKKRKNPGCLHIPERSCEQWNDLLDRRLFVDTLDDHETAFSK
jgi:hypothetical protein